MCFANGLRGLVNGSPLAIAGLLRALDRVPPPDSGVSHLSGTRQDQSLVVGHPVLGLQVSARPIDLAFHPCFVALEIGEVVAVDQKMTVFQFKVGGALQRSRGFSEPAKRNIVDSKSITGDRNVGI